MTQAYVNALKNSSTLPQLQQLLAAIPMPTREVIPLPQRVIEEKQEFDAKLQKVRSALQ